MFSKEKAIVKARAINKNYNYCTEYSDAYLFSVKDSEEIGGAALPIAIMKSDEKIYNINAYIDITKSDLEPISEEDI